MAFATFLGAAPQEPAIYRNEEFGITLRYRKGLVPCPIPETEHDHGPLLIIDPALEKGCNDHDGGRFIGVFASFNAMEATNRLRDFLRSMCGIVSPKDECLPPPPNLEIRGLRSAAARVDHSDGWLDVIMVTQAGKPDPGYDPTAPTVNYDLRLHTKPEYLGQDLRVFRTVLQTIRLNPDESSDSEKQTPK